jgi:hypothetical protein
MAQDYDHENTGYAAAPVMTERSTDRGGLFGRGAERTIGLLALLFTVVVGGFVVKDAIVAGAKDKSGVRTSIAARWNDRTLAFPIEGTDSAGRYALFDVVVLTKDYGWVHGSTEELERDGRRLTAAEIEAEVLAPQLREGLGSARELIAVGLASQEGELEREVQRAGLRASRIAAWVRPTVDTRIPMWTLNLGRYLEPCTECETADTSWQRPFIVIALRQADDGTNIGEALHMALSETSNLPSPSRYSTFALARHSN